MLRIKRALKGMTAAALSGILLLSGATGTSTVIADDTSYTTATVTRGTLSAKAQAKTSVYYPEFTMIQFASDYGSATFVEYVVERGMVVEEGQVIAKIRTEVDDISMEELKLKLKRAEKKYAEFLEQMETALKDAEAAVSLAAGNEKRLAKLRLEKQQLEYDKRLKAEEESIEALRERMQVYENAGLVTEITAPVSGTIGWLEQYRGGDTIWDKAVIGGIYDTDKMLFTVKDMTGVLRYGMKLTLEDGKGKQYEGIVVSTSSDLLNPGLVQEVAYIRAEGADPTQSYNAHYETIRMDDVLLVTASAVKTDTTGSYVMVLKDGKPSKQYFAAAKTINGQCYILSGLEEGTTVIIN